MRASRTASVVDTVPRELDMRKSSHCLQNATRQRSEDINEHARMNDWKNNGAKLSRHTFYTASVVATGWKQIVCTHVRVRVSWCVRVRDILRGIIEPASVRKCKRGSAPVAGDHFAHTCTAASVHGNGRRCGPSLQCKKRPEEIEGRGACAEFDGGVEDGHLATTQERILNRTMERKMAVPRP